MTTEPSALTRAPTEVVEQIVTDLVDFEANRTSYPTTSTLVKDDEWDTIQATIRILQGVLHQRAHAMATSLNTDWAYLVRSESENFADLHDVTFVGEAQ